MKFYRIFACVLLIAMLTVSLSACTPKESMQEVNWDMQGAWISEDGKVSSRNQLCRI